MKWLAEENIDRQIVAELSASGHDVLYIIEIAPRAADEEVLTLANKESAVLLTADKDFGELVYRQGRVSSGVVLLRLAGVPSEHKARLVAYAARQHGEEMEGAFTVITRNAIRIRQH